LGSPVRSVSFFAPGARLYLSGGDVDSGHQETDKKGRGLIFVISAPSGAGKTTLLTRVMKEVPGLRFSVSYTTRPPRSNEQEGRDYHFVSPPVFEKMVERNEFLEWAEVLGNRYGTARINVSALESEGIDLLLDIDTQGAKKVREKVDRSVFIFLLPPSPRLLEERLVKRGEDPPERIRYRVANAMKEVSEAPSYDYVIVNEDVEEAVRQLKAVILAERCRKHKDSILKEKLKQWEEQDGKNYRGRLS
jgi:guanylate kinase